MHERPPPQKLRPEHRPSKSELYAWCATHLGSGVQGTLFESGGLSFVYGLRLMDGREVVAKLRHPEPRLDSCSRIHAYLWSQGYACPEPLLPPTPFGALSVTVERYLPGGEGLLESPERPGLFAEALLRLVRLAGPFQEPFDLEPPSAWLWWDHNERGIWPPPDYIDVNLNAYSEPAWLDDMAAKVRARLNGATLPRVIGHGDWWQPNLRWFDGRLHAVFDWDSLVYLPEAAIAGAAAVQFSVSNIGATSKKLRPFSWPMSRRATGPGRERRSRLPGAAGLWLIAFNAKKQTFEGRFESMEHLARYGWERLTRAGLR